MSKGKLNNFFDGGFGSYFLPGIILQSILIGGGYATGREIISFGGKFGAFGYLSGIGIFLGFTVISILTFEVARIFKAYDYKTLVKQISWKFWPLFDVLIILFSVLGLSVMASASGEVVRQILHFPYWGGVCFMVASIAVLNFFGGWLIERFGTIETVVVYGCYILFSIFVISKTNSNISHVFATNDTSFVSENVSRLTAVKSGIIYVSYNIIVFSTSLFSLKRQTKRRETVIGGILAGAFMTLPWFLTYFSVMGFYPANDVLSASIPWLIMLEKSAPSWVIPLFGVIIIWALITSGTGLIYGLLERVQVGMVEMGRNKLNSKQCAALTIGALTLATILAKIGIIDLIAKGYTIMAYGFIVIYVLPLLTIGFYRIGHPEWKKDFWNKEKKTNIINSNINN